MRVLVTSGGTREPVDDVRVLTNRSTGRLGARLADELHARGHDVTLLHGEEAARPSRDVTRHVFGTTDDLAALLAAHVPGHDAVLHAAAVADYVPERRAGKISSDAVELVLRLVRAPKLIDRLRGLAPDAVLVGFKLTSGADEAARTAAADALRRRARLDLVCVNDTGALGPDDHAALLVGADGVVGRFRGKAEVAAGLADAVEDRLAAAAGGSAS